MSIDYLTKDITTVDGGIVVHGCNCSGGFGSGVAGAIRKKWPHMYEAFIENGTGDHLLGTVNTRMPPKGVKTVVLNGYTQLNYGKDGKKYAKPEAISAVLMTACVWAQTLKEDLYMPKIGAGLGGLDWETEVLPIVEMVSSLYTDVNIHICDI